MTGERVLVCDDWYPMDAVRETLPQAERCDVAGGGSGVAAILVSPDSPVTAADIGRMPDLRVIATASTGVDHIATDAAAKAGIEVRDACPGRVTERDREAGTDGALERRRRRSRSGRRGEQSGNGEHGSGAAHHG